MQCLTTQLGPLANGVGATYWNEAICGDEEGDKSTNGTDDFLEQVPIALLVDAKGAIGPLPFNRRQELKVEEVSSHWHIFGVVRFFLFSFCGSVAHLPSFF